MKTIFSKISVCIVVVSLLVACTSNQSGALSDKQPENREPINSISDAAVQSEPSATVMNDESFCELVKLSTPVDFAVYHTQAQNPTKEYIVRSDGQLVDRQSETIEHWVSIMSTADDTQKRVYESESHENKHYWDFLWIDDDTVLINGAVIYQIRTESLKTISYPDQELLQSQTAGATYKDDLLMFSYSYQIPKQIDSSGRYLLYFKGDPKTQYGLDLYDLQTEQWTPVFESQFVDLQPEQEVFAWWADDCFYWGTIFCQVDSDGYSRISLYRFDLSKLISEPVYKEQKIVVGTDYQIDHSSKVQVLDMMEDRIVMQYQTGIQVVDCKAGDSIFQVTDPILFNTSGISKQAFFFGGEKEILLVAHDNRAAMFSIEKNAQQLFDFPQGSRIRVLAEESIISVILEGQEEQYEVLMETTLAGTLKNFNNVYTEEEIEVFISPFVNEQNTNEFYEYVANGVINDNATYMATAYRKDVKGEDGYFLESCATTWVSIRDADGSEEIVYGPIATDGYTVLFDFLWLDQDCVLVNGAFIYDVSEKELLNLRFPCEKLRAEKQLTKQDDDFLLFVFSAVKPQLLPAKEMILYDFGDYGQYVYDIKNDSWQENAALDKALSA